MNPLIVTILAALQGITEFLPVSSSGHLVAAQYYLGLRGVPILFDLILHLGTLSATLLVYSAEVWSLLKALVLWPVRGAAGREDELRTLLYLGIGVAVTGAVGLLLRGWITAFFQDPKYLPLFFFVTGSVLLGTRFVGTGYSVRMKTRFDGGTSAHSMDTGRSILIGLAQSSAVLPGISRSGFTIAGGLYLGLDREFAATFSFLLSIPSILGASAVETYTAGAAGIAPGTALLAYVLSLAVGYGALRLLLRTLKQSKLHIFSYYCFAAAVLLGVLQLLGR